MEKKFENKILLQTKFYDYLKNYHGIENLEKNFRCLNPNHQDSTPSMTYYKDTNKVFCHGCSVSYNIFNLIGLDYGLNTFSEQYNKALDLFSISEMNFKATETSNLKTLNKDGENLHNENKNQFKGLSEPLNDKSIFEYIEQCHKDINKTDYFLYRGINDVDVIEKYKLGYDVKSNCVILPTSKNYYIKRLADKDKKSFYNMPNMPTEIFNIEYLKTLGSNDSVFIVESYFDALSIESFSEKAIALNSTSNIKKLIETIIKYKPKCKILVSLDNDETGKEAQKNLLSELKNLQIFFLQVDLNKDFKDANEHLMKNSNSFSNSVRESLYETYQKENNQESYELEFLNYLEKSKNLEKIPTYFNKLDDVLDGGFHEGLYILGAISSLGKTTFVLQMADMIAKNGQDVLIFSLEMSKRELYAKSLSRLTCLLDYDSSRRNAKTARNILDGKKYDNFSDIEKNLMNRAFVEYRKIAKNLYITESLGSLGVNEIKQAIEKHISFTGKTPLVIIDYLQILNPISEKLTDKQNMDKSVSELKRISREFEIPVLAISSLNRASYNNNINMEAFKESGAIEYSSDVLIGLQFKNPDKIDINDLKSKDIREIELKILKNRSGAICKPIEYDYYPKFNYFVENAI